MGRPRKITIKDIMTEDELTKWMNVTTDQLKDLRNKKQFPYISVSLTKRMYWVDDVVQWCKAQRVNIPISEEVS